jgi:hypothetical protein
MAQGVEVRWTENFPIPCIRDGKWCVEITIGSEVIRAPIGDGRRFAELVFERLVGPAIAPRRTDPAPVDFDDT